MAHIEPAPEVGEDLERILDPLQRHEAAQVPGRLRELIEAIGVLETCPPIGRLASGDKRELVIGRGAHGDLALYRDVAQIETVFVLWRCARSAKRVRGPLIETGE